MDTNAFYDKVIALYKQYSNHVNYVERKKKDFAEKKKEIAKMLLESDSDEAIEKISFEVFIEDKLHSNDINLIFNNLYNTVQTYVEVDNSIILPKEITDICTKYADIVMKTMYVVNDSLISEERVKGSVDKIKDTIVKTGEMKAMAEQFKKLIGVEN